MSSLFLDISEEFVSINVDGTHHVTNIESSQLWENPENLGIDVKEFLKEKEIKEKDLVLTVPIINLNYQIVTLPEIEEKDKLTLLGLEIDSDIITKRFNYFELAVTKREEEGGTVCDYMVLSLKPGIYEQVLEFTKGTGLNLSKVVPSFFLVAPAQREGLTASAWVGNDRLEIVIWGKNNPLAMSTADNTGDQMGDINRYISHYFDQFGGLELSKIKLYGPRMRDASLTYSLTYPNEIIEDPRLVLCKRLPAAEECLDISQIVKLPRPPLEFNARNIGVLVAGALAIIMLFVTSFYYLENTSKNGELVVLRTEVDKNKKLLIKSRQLERKVKELEKEKDFYLSITKRRTPWAEILTELAKLTPKALWIERLNATKATLQISGKATKPEEVSDFEINLNNSSSFFKNAQVVGIRDFLQEGRKYTEYQMMVKLNSPTEN